MDKRIILILALIAAPWVIGMIFDAVIWLRVPNPADWDKASRGIALFLSFASLAIMVPIGSGED